MKIMWNMDENAIRVNAHLVNNKSVYFQAYRNTYENRAALKDAGFKYDGQGYWYIECQSLNEIKEATQKCYKLHTAKPHMDSDVEAYIASLLKK